MSQYPNWTAERAECVIALWKAGQSGGQIAVQLGITRNAVIGKLHRLGLSRNDGVHRTGRPRKARSALPRKKKRGERRPPSLELVKAPTRVALATKPVRFLDRRMYHECCAILNDGAPIEGLMVCGGAIPSESLFEFCEAHQALFLAPNSRRARAA